MDIMIFYENGKCEYIENVTAILTLQDDEKKVFWIVYPDGPFKVDYLDVAQIKVYGGWKYKGDDIK